MLLLFLMHNERISEKSVSASDKNDFFFSSEEHKFQMNLFFKKEKIY